MKFVGVDLHKKTIFVCVMKLVDGVRKVVRRKRLKCKETGEIFAFFQQLGQFKLVVEATSNYEWFLALIEELADRCVLAHPKKLRVIAESKNKSDKIDAHVLAEFLLLDIIPEAYRPSSRIREYRVLVRQRKWLDGRVTSLKCKLRTKLAHYNADIPQLFTNKGKAHREQIKMSPADEFTCNQLFEMLMCVEKQLIQVTQELKKFAKSAPAAEKEARAILDTMPEVGPVTIDIVISELGDWRRFRNAKKITAYAGLDPGFRKSDGKSKELHITKEGSRLLRWAMVELAWRLANKYQRWATVFENLIHSTGSKKKAIVGVARRVLCVMYAMLRDGKSYQMAAAA